MARQCATLVLLTLDVIFENIFPSGMLNEVADLSEHCKTMCKKLGGKEVPEELIR